VLDAVVSVGAANTAALLNTKGTTPPRSVNRAARIRMDDDARRGRTRRHFPQSTAPAVASATRRRQVRAGALGDFRGHADGFAKGRVRMDGAADVDRVGAHFDREGDFADQVTGVGADDATTDDAMRLLIEQQFRGAFVAAVRNRTPGR
jgi:hypothetical protein